MTLKNLFFMVIMFPVSLVAQINFPPASPDASWSHQLGFTKIELSYSRPHMRNRKIFGALVPYNELWRTGAGESTRIKFSEDIVFGGKSIAKGLYAMYSIPGKDEWTIILNSDATLHGDFGYDEKKDVLRVKVKPGNSKITKESFTIELTDFKPDYSANLQLGWENTVVKIPILSTAHSIIMTQIQENLVFKKSENAPLLNKGAQYYFLQKHELNQALSWSQKSESLDSENFNYAFLSVKILEQLKLFPEAVKSAERAIQLGKEDELTEEVKLLEGKISEWTNRSKSKKK